jgi:F-type H+-transporting ATPase subunit epsilon
LTPDCIFKEEEVEELLIRAVTGKLGVMSGHASLITTVDIGALQFRQQSGWTSIAVIGGLAFIQNDCVSIIVNSAETRCSIDQSSVVKALAAATDRLNLATHKREKIEAASAFKRARACYNIILIMSKYRGPRVRVIRRLGILARFTKKLAKSTTFR